MMKLTQILGALALVAGASLASGCALQPGEEEPTSTESSSAALGTQPGPSDPLQQAGGPVNPLDKVAADNGDPQGPTPWPWRSFEEGAAERPPIPDPSNPLVDTIQQKK